MDVSNKDGVLPQNSASSPSSGAIPSLINQKPDNSQFEIKLKSTDSLKPDQNQN